MSRPESIAHVFGGVSCGSREALAMSNPESLGAREPETSRQDALLLGDAGHGSKSIAGSPRCRPNGDKHCFVNHDFGLPQTNEPRLHSVEVWERNWAKAPC